MLKQLLTGGSVLALLLLGSLAAQANPKEPRLQSQAPSTSPALMARRLPQHLVVQPALVLIGTRTTPGTQLLMARHTRNNPEGTIRPKQLLMA